MKLRIFLVSLVLAGCSGNGSESPDAGAPDHRFPDAPVLDLPGLDLPLADSPPAADAFAPLPGPGVLSGACGELDDTEWTSASPYLFRNAIALPSTGFDPSQLSPGGLKVWTDGNRGGSSLHSEVFSFEVLHRCELAKLLKTETFIDYTDAGGKKTDLLLEIDARKIGVSVTGAYHYPPTDPYTEAEAKTLLDKKLADLPLSQANAATQDAWERSVLHVFAYDSQHADVVQSAWAQVDAATKGDAILVLTVTDGLDDYIY